jgi:hypothetical protein
MRASASVMSYARGRWWAARHQAQEKDSPECAEGGFSERRPHGLIGSPHGLGPAPSGLLMHRQDRRVGCAQYKNPRPGRDPFNIRFTRTEWGTMAAAARWRRGSAKRRTRERPGRVGTGIHSAIPAGWSATRRRPTGRNLWGAAAYPRAAEARHIVSLLFGPGFSPSPVQPPSLYSSQAPSSSSAGPAGPGRSGLSGGVSGRDGHEHVRASLV